MVGVKETVKKEEDSAVKKEVQAVNDTVNDSIVKKEEETQVKIEETVTEPLKIEVPGISQSLVSAASEALMGKQEFDEKEKAQKELAEKEKAQKEKLEKEKLAKEREKKEKEKQKSIAIEESKKLEAQGDVAFQSDDVTKALFLFKRAMSAKARSILNFKIGKCYVHMGNKGEAKKYLTKYLNTLPKNSDKRKAVEDMIPK